MGAGRAAETAWRFRVTVCAVAEWEEATPANAPARAREKMEARRTSFMIVNSFNG